MNTLEMILSICAPLLTLLLSWGAIVLTNTIRRKVGNDYARGVLERLADAAYLAVNVTQQTVVASLKASAADGKLTKGEATDALYAAKDHLKTYLGTKGVEALAEIVDSDMIEDAIEAAIESEIADRKGGQ